MRNKHITFELGRRVYRDIPYRYFSLLIFRNRKLTERIQFAVWTKFGNIVIWG